MTTYELSWGRGHHRSVSTGEELDQVLDQVSALRDEHGAAYMIDIVPAGHDDPLDQPGLQIGIASDRGFVFYIGPDGPSSGYAYQPDLEPLPDAIGFNYGGQRTDYEPAKTRLTPAQVRRLARDYVNTGHQPGGVCWFDPAQVGAEAGTP